MDGRIAVPLLLGCSALVAACGPSQNAPPDQAPPPPAAQPAAAAPASAAPAGPSAADEQMARLKEEERRLARQQKRFEEEEAARKAQPAAAACGDCGVVASVTPVRKAGEAGWAGTLGGAAAGGLAGNQFGKGKGNTAMTVLGVVGGAFAGREVEKQVTADTVYQVAVNMETGGTRTVTVANGQGLAAGTRVHVDGNSLQPY